MSAQDNDQFTERFRSRISRYEYGLQPGTVRKYLTLLKHIVKMEVIRECGFRAVDWLRDEHSPRFRKLRFVKWYKCDGYKTQDLLAAWKLLYEWVKETHRPVNYYAELQGMLEPLRRYEKKANVSPLLEDSDSDSDRIQDLRRFQKKHKVTESSSDSDPPSNSNPFLDNRREPQPRAGPSTDKNLPSETAELAVSQQSKQRLDANEESGMDFSTSTELYPSGPSDYHDDSDVRDPSQSSSSRSFPHLHFHSVASCKAQPTFKKKLICGQLELKPKLHVVRLGIGF
jgi:hypothetical protein